MQRIKYPHKKGSTQKRRGTKAYLYKKSRKKRRFCGAFFALKRYSPNGGINPYFDNSYPPIMTSPYPTSNPFQKILVINVREIGDVLLSTPLFSVLKQTFPLATLYAVVPSHTMDMLSGNPDVDHIIPLTRYDRKKNRWMALKSDLSLLANVRSIHPDLVIDLTSNDRSALLSFMSGSKLRISRKRKKGFLGRNRLYTHCIKIDSKKHMVNQFLQVLSGIGLKANPKHYPLSLTFSDQDQKSVKPHMINNGPFIHFSPVSRLSNKCWNDTHMANLIDHVIQKGYTAIVTSSPNPEELKRAQAILNQVTQNSVIDLTGKLTLKQLASITQQSRLFIGVDSAPLHMAAALKTPVIALFGPSNETIWHPWLVNHRVVSLPLQCRLPCKQKKTCQTFECLQNIDLKTVIKTVDELLEETKNS